MGVTALPENRNTAVRAAVEVHEGWFADGIARLKAAVVEIAAAKSSQQFGREEEKE
jgi:hypothetical protein